jgi:hypothetical protein
MSYFSVYINKDVKASLNWVTEAETNNSYYIIERSVDSKNFIGIGMVLGSMNSSIRKTYKYIDDLKTIDAGKTIYYRIKQVDYNGKYSYSPVRSVKLSQKQDIIQINPNPFVDNITVKFMSETNGTVNIRLVNMTGQTVLNKTTTIIKGFNNTGIYNLAYLPKGIYTVSVMVNDEESGNTKLVKY